MFSYEQKRPLENVDQLIEDAEKVYTARFKRELPDTIENIAKKYATRRVNPVISPSIPEDVKQAMLSHRMSDKDYLDSLLLAIHDMCATQKKSSNKKSYLIVSQTGAGKTALRSKIIEENPDVIVINYDLYKQYRPDCDQIRAEDPVHFGQLTAIDSYDQGSDITDFAIEHGYEILLECAPSSRDGLVNIDLNQMARAGYELEFDIMATGDLISGLGIHRRYEEAMLEKKPDAKLTDLDRHDDSYKALAMVALNFSTKNIMRLFRRGTDEEKRIPQDLNAAIGTEWVTLLQERERSNMAYVEAPSGVYDPKNPASDSEFSKDYQFICSAMQSRCPKGMSLAEAFPVEAKQLSEIVTKYKNFVIDRKLARSTAFPDDDGYDDQSLESL